MIISAPQRFCLVLVSLDGRDRLGWQTVPEFESSSSPYLCLDNSWAYVNWSIYSLLFCSGDQLGCLPVFPSACIILPTHLLTYYLTNNHPASPHLPCMCLFSCLPGSHSSLALILDIRMKTNVISFSRFQCHQSYLVPLCIFLGFPLKLGNFWPVNISVSTQKS